MTGIFISSSYGFKSDIPPGSFESVYKKPGTYLFTVPINVESISIVCVGGGGGGSIGNTPYTGGNSGGGGGLGYLNDYPVTPGETYVVYVGSGGTGGQGASYSGSSGSSSYFSTLGGTILASAGGGQGGEFNAYSKFLYSTPGVGHNLVNVDNGDSSFFFAGSATTSFLIGTATSTAWALKNNWIIEFWIYPVDISSTIFSGTTNQYILWNGTASTNILIYLTSNRLYITSAAYVTKFPTSVWTHVAIICKTGSLSCYFNGVSQTITGTKTSVNITSTAQLHLGAYATSFATNGTADSFYGLISNLRIISYVTPNYASGTIIPPSVPFRLDSSDSNILMPKDFGQNSFPITLTSYVEASTKITPFSGSNLGQGNVSLKFSDGPLTISGRTQLSFGTDDFCIESWVYPTALNTSYAGIIDTRSGVVSQPWAFGLRNISGVYNTELYLASNIIYRGLKPVPLNSWTHVAFIRSNGLLMLYVNGVIDTSWPNITTAINANNDNQLIGQVYDGFSMAFFGYLSNLRVVNNVAYTFSYPYINVPIERLSATNSTVLLTCNSPTISDTSNNNLTITKSGATNNVVASSSGPFTSMNYSYYFDGVGDWIQTTNSSLFNFSDASTLFTIEAWIYPTITTSARGITGSRGSGVGNGWCFYISAGILTMGAFFVGIGWTNPITLNTTTIPANAWTHVAVAKDTTGYVGYINGIPGNRYATTNGMQYLGTSYPLTIGALSSGGESPLTGYISNFRITVGAEAYPERFGSGIPINNGPAESISGTQLLLLAERKNTNQLLTCCGDGNTFIDYGINNFSVVLDSTRYNNFSSTTKINPFNSSYGGSWGGLGAWSKTSGSTLYSTNSGGGGSAGYSGPGGQGSVGHYDSLTTYPWLIPADGRGGGGGGGNRIESQTTPSSPSHIYVYGGGAGGGVGLYGQGGSGLSGKSNFTTVDGITNSVSSQPGLGGSGGNPGLSPDVRVNGGMMPNGGEFGGGGGSGGYGLGMGTIEWTTLDLLTVDPTFIKVPNTNIIGTDTFLKNYGIQKGTQATSFDKTITINLSGGRYLFSARHQSSTLAGIYFDGTLLLGYNTSVKSAILTSVTAGSHTLRITGIYPFGLVVENISNVTGGAGGGGAVRVIWGDGKLFPSNAA